MHISLTPELENLVKAKVESGLYNNASEVVREALRSMYENDNLKKLKEKHLIQAIDIGMHQAENEMFVEDFSINSIIDELDSEDAIKN